MGESMIEVLLQKCTWMFILTKESTKQYMILTEEEAGDGDTYVLDDLMDDGWEIFCDLCHTHKQSVKYMSNYFPEYELMKYQIVPITFKSAKEFVDKYHRHHVAPQGYKFAIAATDGDIILGVAIAGRPVSRYRDDGKTLEVTRLCVKKGYKNLCSLLYSRVSHIAKEMGYQNLITYTLQEECGKSLSASGFALIGSNKGGSWNSKGRRRIDKHPVPGKSIWSKSLVG